MLTFLTLFVQVVWWGHPDTTASTAVDFFLGLDDEVDDAATNQYHEQLIRAELINTAPFAADPAAVPWEEAAPALTIEAGPASDTPATFGLAHDKPPGLVKGTPRHHGGCDTGADTHIFIVLGRLFKLHPNFDDALLTLLHTDPRAIVALIQERHEAWTSAVWARIVAAANEREAAEAAKVAQAEGGVAQTFVAATVLERVRFVHHWNYVRALRLPSTAAVLDTWPYGGCLTALEALSSGRPVVTLPAPFARGRFALAMYRQMGLAPPRSGGLVASSLDEYARFAADLGSDLEWRRSAVEATRAGYAALDRNYESAREWTELLVGLKKMQPRETDRSL